MSKKRDEFEERMDVLATETTKLEARLLRLGAEIAHQEIWTSGRSRSPRRTTWTWRGWP